MTLGSFGHTVEAETYLVPTIRDRGRWPHARIRHPTDHMYLQVDLTPRGSRRGMRPASEQHQISQLLARRLTPDIAASRPRQPRRKTKLFAAALPHHSKLDDPSLTTARSCEHFQPLTQVTKCRSGDRGGVLISMLLRSLRLSMQPQSVLVNLRRPDRLPSNRYDRDELSCLLDNK